jgi:hypothetical protein
MPQTVGRPCPESFRSIGEQPLKNGIRPPIKGRTKSRSHPRVIIH